ncbi:MAG: sodium:solute symporter [Hyphomicrobiaceae bacterium]|nr:sodium:solute symporter [Hyphomicrobiaceae bacterium]
MSLAARARLVNPRLGIYFSIFASTFAALVIMLVVLEELGIGDDLVRLAMLTGLLGLFVGIGLLGYTREPLEYFAAGRRVPAVYGGLGLAMSGLGATGMAAVTGLLFVVGIDGIFFISGGVAGFVVTAVLLAPFLRKFGAFTLPTYLGRRFDSRMIRVVSAAVLAVPALLVLAGELTLGARTIGWLTGSGAYTGMAVLIGAIVAGTVAGGMRSLAWTNVAAGIAAILAASVPLAIAAILSGYLPLAPLSHGPLLRAIGNLEGVQGLPVFFEALFGANLPQSGLQPVLKRFSEPFGATGPAAYVLLTLTTMMGLAAAPWLLPRIAMSPGVYDARKSLGWATFFFGLMMLTAATIAVFMRGYLMKLAGVSIASPPEWLTVLSQQGFAEVATRGTRIALTGVSIDRDMVIVALPIAAGLPMAFAYLAAAGIIAASFAAASATALTIGNLLSEDIVHGLSWTPREPRGRLGMARLLVGAVALFGGFLALAAGSDPLKLLLWALAMTASCAFPLLVASIWWKRVNVYGAFASLTAGFLVSVIVIVAAEAGLIGLPSELAAVIALPASLIGLVAVSLTTVPPSRHQLELVRDIRIPGGEILYDREMRMMKQKDRKRA